VQVGEAAALVRQRPPVEIAPRFEHPQHTVEVTSQGTGLALDSPLEIVHLGLGASSLGQRTQMAVAVGAPGDRMRLCVRSGAGVFSSARARRTRSFGSAKARLLQAARDL